MSVAIILLGLGACLFAWLERPRDGRVVLVAGVGCAVTDENGWVYEPGCEPREVGLP